MKKHAVLLLIISILTLILPSCGDQAATSAGSLPDRAVEESESVAEDAGSAESTGTVESTAPTELEIPAYQGEPSVQINGGVPEFDESELTTESFEKYGALDKRGRCTMAVANLSVDTQPGGSESRGDISAVHPSGWKSGQGWERCHLIGWQLSGENDNPKNLVTGTHYMNVDGMLPYENQVAYYIEETGNHVLYSVRPAFAGKNMVCSGVQMQARSVEDDGEGVSFNVFCFNVSPGREINYKTGEVTVTDEEQAAANVFERGYVLNRNTMRFHYPSCSSVASMAEHNKEYDETSREELIEAGYEPCGNCEP